MINPESAAPVSDPNSFNVKKYETKNRVLRLLIFRFQALVSDLIEPLKLKTVLDVGCGEGYLDRALLDRFPHLELTGADISEAAVTRARLRCPDANFVTSSVEKLPHVLGGRYDLVICSELLEHLPHPQTGLNVVVAYCERYALLTVPWEPWFQLANFLRGKYLNQLGNHPEHIQRWSRQGFYRFAGRAFKPLQCETSFPWNLFLGEVRH